ncbi:MAG: tetratricopeptide repeat protein [Bacteroidetes bacterium]|nr:tetratricopeptide repeat protein [Bacteroidota bacterium]MCH8942090.1 tetratricopeptide repeat protein [Bacteroidota bacterium]
MGNNRQIEFKLNNAKKFAASGKFLHASQLYKSLIEEFPDNAEPYFQLAQLYQDQNLSKESENLLLNYLNENPDRIDVIIYLAQIYLKSSKWNEVVEILTPVTPDEEPYALFLIGYAYFMLEDYEIAKINFENFLKFNNEPELFYETQLFLSKIYLAQSKFNKALEYAEKSEKFYSNYWELKFIYAEIYLSTKMINHAIKNIETCIKMSTANYKVYKLAGEIYYKAKNYIKSEKYFVECISLNENQSTYLYIKLADICIKNKKIDKAVNYYDLVLKMNSKHNIALKGKKNALSLLKNQNTYNE